MWWIYLLLTAVTASQLPLGVHRPRVNVTLYVMSRCPDARTCEKVFEEVISQVGSKINLEMDYIAARNTSESLGYTCKHGELECIGNSHQLCLHKHLSLSDFYTNLACQNNFYDDIGKISLTKQCAELSKTKWLESGVGECVEGKESERLFKRNVEKTIADEVGTSCTINIDSTIVYGGARRCVVDGGVWRGCNDGHTASDFIRIIEDEWKHLQ